MTVWVEIAGVRHRVELPAIEGMSEAFRCVVDDRELTVDARMLEPGVLSLILEGWQYRCTLDGDAVLGDVVLIGGRRYPFAVDDPRSLRGRSGAADGAAGPRTVKAPMPGRVVRVLVAVGDEVAEQQGVVVIEAMKMQNELKSPKAGRVVRVNAVAEATVGAGESLVVIE